MYTKEQLAKYPYFKSIDLDYVLDQLTGVIARPYILGFAKYLIDNKIQFMMGIMDIDNFKLINDNYGHGIGDQVLHTVATDLADVVGDTGLVGRFGGDEFIVIHLGPTDYDSIHAYIKNLYGPGKAIRRTVVLDTIHPFVTGTTGCACFPNDAKDYEDLFNKVDKALYRGKSKGRNCFIVYVDAKHKDIDVHKKNIVALPYRFENINNICNRSDLDIVGKYELLADYVVDTITVTDFLIYSAKGDVYSHKLRHTTADAVISMEQIELMLNGKMLYFSADINDTKKISKPIREFIDNNHIQAIIVQKIMFNGVFYGYIVMHETMVIRIWQENDRSLLMYLAQTIAMLNILENK